MYYTSRLASVGNSTGSIDIIRDKSSQNRRKHKQVYILLGETAQKNVG